MKKLLSVFALLLVFLGIGINAYAIDWMLPGGQYLVEDDMLSATATAANDGWDSHEAGGDIGSTWGSGTWFSDTSEYTDVDMTRKINETSSGRVSLEYLYWFEENIDGFKWMVRNGETPVVTIKTKGTSLYAVKPDGEEVWLYDYKVISENDKTAVKDAGASVPYTLGTGVRIDMDLDAKLYNIYINGALCGENIPMADNVINGIQFISTKEGTGKLYITVVRCYRNYWVNETHVSSLIGNALPQTFKAVKDGGSIAIEQMNSQLWMDVSNIRFKSDGSGKELSYSRELDVTDDLVAFEYMVIDTEKKGGFKASFGDGMTITMDNDAFAFNGQTFYTNYYKNLWYNVKVIADYSKGLCDVYLNNIKRLENAPLAGKARNMVRFEAIGGANINIGLDDIQIYPMLPEPEDYVSEPQKVNSPLEVGMWSCSLWRSGKQGYGWDKIKPYPEREPVLGFYDEGNPEVNDWETKYMAEHGVDFQMFCWFKPDGSYANPIKTPNWSYALEDGLKMSKYKDMQKYTFTFENLTASIKSPEMFKDFVVPYWIEYYFKDPNFYKYNNKPVVNIYQVKYFIGQLSGNRDQEVTEETVAVAKETLKWFEEECIRQGFDGVELWTSSVTGSNGVGFDVLKELGFVCGCPYGLDGASGTTLSYAQSMMLQGNENDFDMLGIAVTGMDAEPWLGKKGIMTDVETFDAMCKWIANEYAPKIAKGERAKKIVMIDNWNEIGEGHYVGPMKSGYGWTRMESIRKYFCDRGEDVAHEHELPTENQLSRIHVLYDQDREGFLTSAGGAAAKYPTKVIKGWYFDTGFDGWTFSSKVDPSIEDGTLHYKSTGQDTMMFANNINVNMDEVAYIKVRIKASKETAKMTEFFFRNPSMNQYVWNYNFRAMMSDGDFQDIYIKTSTNKLWTGTMNALRYDPFDGQGEVWIDSIELLGDLEDPTGLVVSDGEIVPIEVANINGVGMVNIADVVKNFREDAKFDWTTKGYDNLKFAVGEDIYEVKAGEKTYSVNSVEYELENPFEMYGDNLYAPVEFFVKPLGAKEAKYNEEENAAYFTIKNVTWRASDDTLNEWKFGGSFYSKRGKGDFVTLKTKAYEAWAESPAKLGMKAGRIKNVKVKFANNTGAKYAKIYYKLKDQSLYSGGSVTIFDIKPYSKDVIEYNVPVHWTGNELDSIKIVFSNEVGTVNVEEIKLEY
ncbi:MAG: glycoside hydrolase family 99-like domain-containing protein [Clostridiales bacterium]|nr:glycoside hydrolase family 99-like domain-containing protein [Clostridiales bacterium]